MGGESSEWDLKTYLLAAAVDSLRLLWWAKTQDGQDGKNPPDPVPRPEQPALDEPSEEDFNDVYAYLQQKNGPRELTV